MTDIGVDICANCGRAGDYGFEWRGVAFCSPECRTMYATELAEQEHEWRDLEVALEAIRQGTNSDQEE